MKTLINQEYELAIIQKKADILLIEKHILNIMSVYCPDDALLKQGSKTLRTSIYAGEPQHEICFKFWDVFKGHERTGIIEYHVSLIEELILNIYNINADLYTLMTDMFGGEYLES